MQNKRKIMSVMKQKKSDHSGKRILITINVLGSAGPMRFVVNENVTVGNVIDIALKSYAREGRLPLLGTDFDSFFLYCPTAASYALSPCEAIGTLGMRNFILCKRLQSQKADTSEVEARATGITRKSSGNWKTWFTKTLSLKVASH